MATSSHAHRRQHWASYADPEARKGRGGRPYRTFRTMIRDTRPPICCRCGQWIDKALPHTNPWSWSLDHLDPLGRGGAPLNPKTAAPAHLVCNKRHQPKKIANGTPRRVTIRRVANRLW